MPGNRHWVGRPVADAVHGQYDDAHAQYGDNDERGDHKYGDVDAQQCKRWSPCKRDIRYRVIISVEHYPDKLSKSIIFYLGDKPLCDWGKKVLLKASLKGVKLTNLF
jgi:hypothetical protein